MESLTTKAERDNKIMKLLKLDDIRHPIFSSDKGDLRLVLAKGGSAKDYFFILDAVPVGKEEQKKLMACYNGILFTV